MTLPSFNQAPRQVSIRSFARGLAAPVSMFMPKREQTVLDFCPLPDRHIKSFREDMKAIGGDFAAAIAHHTSRRG